MEARRFRRRDSISGVRIEVSAICYGMPLRIKRRYHFKPDNDLSLRHTYIISADCVIMVLQAIKYSHGQLEILDQLRLPHEEVYIEITKLQNAWTAIKSMQVRGAPAIAIVGALSIAVELAQVLHDTEGSPSAAAPEDAARSIATSLAYLVTSRPTAVNLADAATKLSTVANSAAERPHASSKTVFEAYIKAAEQMLVDDVQDNERIGRYGAQWILQNGTPASSHAKVSVLTHCNTG